MRPKAKAFRIRPAQPPRLKRRMMGRKGFQRPVAALPVSGVARDRYFMRKTLRLAEWAARQGEVPVGALLVRDGRILLNAINQVEATQNGLAHAELLLLQEASRRFGRRLNGMTLYVNLEPCVMCAAALLHARVGRLVYGASDPERGGCGADPNVLGAKKTLHHLSVTQGIMEERSRRILRAFFQRRRQEGRRSSSSSVF